MTRRKIPSPYPQYPTLGCWAWLIGVAVVGWLLPVFWPKLVVLAIWFSVPLGLTLLYRIRGWLLLATAGAAIGRQGKRGVLVYSESPNWQTYVESNWLPKLGEHVVVLNWSRNRQWSKRDPAVRLFHWFVGTSHQYNPAVLLLRGMRRPFVFRFYQAFRDAKHGKTASLRSLEEQMFAEIP